MTPNIVADAAEDHSKNAVDTSREFSPHSDQAPTGNNKGQASHSEVHEALSKRCILSSQYN